MKEEIFGRIAALRDRMEAEGIEAALVFQKVDLFYLTGTMQDGLLYLDSSHELLLIRRHPPRAQEESPLELVLPYSSLKELPDLIRGHTGRLPEVIGLEMDVVPVGLFRRLQGLFPGGTFKDLSPLILHLRRRKSPWEVAMMERAGEIGRRVYEEVPRVLQEGMTELELAGKLLLVAMAHGHQEYIRMRGFNAEAHSWHVLSGPSGAMLSSIDAPMGGLGPSPAYPMGASPKRIGRHEPILIDFGTSYWGYQADETRCFSIGRLPRRLKDAFSATREILAEVVALARPGASCQRLFERGWEVARRLGYEDYFMGPEGYKTRFIGHGIGLEINEPPFIAEGHDYPLEEGMTVALEPKMVFPGEGAVGIENTYLVTQRGLRSLTPAPEDLIEVSP